MKQSRADETSRFWSRLKDPKIVVSVVAFTLLSVFSVIALVVLGSTQSSQDKAPEKTLLTEKVQSRVLVSSIVSRGTIESGGESQIGCYPSSANSEARVFTRAPLVGSIVKEGGVLGAVNGRPVFLLSGAIPAFRDILPGSSGEDIEQLQSALRKIGYKITDKKGTMGASTQSAVAKMYKKAGFVPIEPSFEQQAALRSAQDALTQAKAQVVSTTAELKAARGGSSRSAILSAEIAVAQAKRDVSNATGADLAIAKKQLEIAKTELVALKKKPDVNLEQVAVAEAVKAVNRVKKEISTLKETTGITVPYCEVVFLPSLPVTVSGVRGTASNTDELSADSLSTGWASVASGDLVILTH